MKAKSKSKLLMLIAVICITAMLASVSVFFSAAADTLKRVPSIIPGTDKEYNYVENVTVKIPGTNVTYELNDVYEKVGVVYEDDIPVYRFSFLEKDSGSVILKQDGEYLDGIYFYYVYYESDGEMRSHSEGDAFPFNFKSVDTLNHKSGYHEAWTSAYDSYNEASVKFNWTYIRNDGSCSFTDNNNTILARVEFYWGTGCKCDNGYEYPYDLISYEDAGYWVSKDIEKIDISLLDINYQPNEDYKIIDGANSVVDSNTKFLKIRVDAEFSKFTGVTVDGKAVDSSNYTTSEGSTIIEFNAEYLNTLSVGEHTVTILFTDGEATTQFEIKRDKDTGNTDTTDTTEKTDNPIVDVEIPNTNNELSNSTAIYAFVLTLIAVTAILGIAVIRRKKYLVK